MLKLTHRVEINQVLIHLGVAEYGVAFAHPPQHALKRLHLHSLDQTRHKPVTEEENTLRLGTPLT